MLRASPPQQLPNEAWLPEDGGARAAAGTSEASASEEGGPRVSARRRGPEHECRGRRRAAGVRARTASGTKNTAASAPGPEDGGAGAS